MVGANANPLLVAKNGDTAHSLAAKRHRVALVIAEACAVHAIEHSDMPALLKSIENGAYVNIHNAAGWTPLIFAVSQGNVEAVQFLLRHGAEADRQVECGQSLTFRWHLHITQVWCQGSDETAQVLCLLVSCVVVPC